MPGGIGLQRLRRVCMKVTAYESLSSHSTRHLKRFSSKMLKSRGILHRPRRGISQRASTSVWPVVRCFSFFLASALCRRKTRKKKKRKEKKRKGRDSRGATRAAIVGEMPLLPRTARKRKRKRKRRKKKRRRGREKKKKGKLSRAAISRGIANYAARYVAARGIKRE